MFKTLRINIQIINKNCR